MTTMMMTCSSSSSSQPVGHLGAAGLGSSPSSGLITRDSSSSRHTGTSPVLLQEQEQQLLLLNASAKPRAAPLAPSARTLAPLLAGRTAPQVRVLVLLTVTCGTI